MRDVTSDSRKLARPPVGPDLDNSQELASHFSECWSNDRARRVPTPVRRDGGCLAWRYPDIVVVIPGLIGSVLSKDGKRLWGTSAGALYRMNANTAVKLTVLTTIRTPP